MTKTLFGLIALMLSIQFLVHLHKLIRDVDDKGNESQ